MCEMCRKALHIFCGSAMRPLDLALGTVPTRAGGCSFDCDFQNRSV
jgi:hypothetical protein